MWAPFFVVVLVVVDAIVGLVVLVTLVGVDGIVRFLWLWLLLML